MPVIFDAEGVVTGDFANLLGGDAVLSSRREGGGKVAGGDRHEGASAAFVEEGEFSGVGAGEIHHCTQGKSGFLAARTPLGMTV